MHRTICIVSVFALVSVIFTALPTAAQNPADYKLTGRWTGTASTDTEQTGLVIDIVYRNDEYVASMSLTDIGVTDWPALSVDVNGDAVTIEFPSDSGPQTMKLTFEVDTAAGTWRESRFKQAADVRLMRSSDSRDVGEERLLVHGPAGAIGVSIFIPECPNTCPGVVFLHGSGPQPRDSNRFAALALAEHGIASAIFDKRGVGASAGELVGASFDDLADDALAVAVEFLARPEVSAVGFFGHSQGGWIAPLAASRFEATAFVITSAGPAVPPSREAEWDVVRRLRTAGYSPATENAARTVVQHWHRGVRTDDWSMFDAAVDSADGSAWFRDADFSVFLSRPGPSYTESYRAFMDFDPIPVLQKLDVPLLAVLAPEDESIDAMETADILLDLAAESLDLTLRLYPGYDHSIRRLGLDDEPVRWPEQPADYYSVQADFIGRSVK